MTTRTTAEIVADLRGSISEPRLGRDRTLHEKVCAEAADRLTELDAEVARLTFHQHFCLSCSDGTQPGKGCNNCRQTGFDQTPCREVAALAERYRDEREVYRNAQISVENELHRIDALRPDCHARCDKGWLYSKHDGSRTLCPDCIDGKVTIERLVARWEAVEFYSNPDGCTNEVLALLDHLRAIR